MISLYEFEGGDLNLFLDRGGPPLPLAIPGCNFPLGFLLAESPDLMGPMVTNPGISSVCIDTYTSPNFPNTLGTIPLSGIIRQGDV